MDDFIQIKEYVLNFSDFLLLYLILLSIIIVIWKYCCGTAMQTNNKIKILQRLVHVDGGHGCASLGVSKSRPPQQLLLQGCLRRVSPHGRLWQASKTTRAVPRKEGESRRSCGRQHAAGCRKRCRRRRRLGRTRLALGGQRRCKQRGGARRKHSFQLCWPGHSF